MLEDVLVVEADHAQGPAPIKGEQQLAAFQPVSAVEVEGLRDTGGAPVEEERETTRLVVADQVLVGGVHPTHRHRSVEGQQPIAVGGARQRVDRHPVGDPRSPRVKGLREDRAVVVHHHPRPRRHTASEDDGGVEHEVHPATAGVVQRDQIPRRRQPADISQRHPRPRLGEHALVIGPHPAEDRRGVGRVQQLLEHREPDQGIAPPRDLQGIRAAVTVGVRVQRIGPVHQHLVPVREPVVVGVPVQRIGPVPVDLHPVVEAVVVRIRVARVGPVHVQLSAIAQPVIVGVGVGRIGQRHRQLVSVVQPVVVGVRVRRIRPVDPHLLAVVQPVVVGVRVQRIGPLASDLLAVREPIVVGVRVQRIRPRDVDLLAVCEPVRVGVRVQRIRPQAQLRAVAEPIQIRVGRGRVGPVHPHLVGVVHPVAIAVGEVGIGAEQHLLPVEQPVAVTIGVVGHHRDRVEIRRPPRRVRRRPPPRELPARPRRIELQHVLVGERDVPQHAAAIEAQQRVAALQQMRAIDVEPRRDPDRAADHHHPRRAGHVDQIDVLHQQPTEVDGPVEGHHQLAALEGEGVDGDPVGDPRGAASECDRVAHAVVEHNVAWARRHAPHGRRGVEHEVEAPAGRLVERDQISPRGQRAEAQPSPLGVPGHDVLVGHDQPTERHRDVRREEPALDRRRRHVGIAPRGQLLEVPAPVAVAVVAERIGPVLVDLGAVRQPIVVAVRVERIGPRGDLGAVGAPIAVGVGVGRIGAAVQLVAVVEPVAVGVGAGGIGPVDVDLIGVGQPVTVGVGARRIGPVDRHLFEVAEPVAIGVSAARIAAVAQDLVTV